MGLIENLSSRFCQHWFSDAYYFSLLGKKETDWNVLPEKKLLLSVKILNP